MAKWLSQKKMDTVTWFQILNEVAFISQSANTLEKGMNPTTLPSAMNKLYDSLGS